jgi:U1 small nuclear ribonucleoprotein
MTQFLPDNLLALFAPRPPIEFKPPPDELLVNRKRIPIGGVAQYVKLFEDPKDTPAKRHVETKEERKAHRRKEKQELLAYKIEQGIAMWAPADNEKATTDPYKTLFVGRINYETSESKLRREFEQFGKIQKIVMVQNDSGKPRGYAFIEYSHKSEMAA